MVTTTEFETGGEVEEQIGTAKNEIPKPIAVKVEAVTVTVLRCFSRWMGMRANSNKMLKTYEGKDTQRHNTHQKILITTTAKDIGQKLAL